MGSTQIKLVYDGVAITAGDSEPRKGTYTLDTAGDLLSFEFNDNADGQVDDLEIVVRNRERLWLSEWRPKRGAKIRASILPAFGDGELVIGDMFVDDFEAGGPPDIATIRAVSVPPKEEIRGTKRTRAWESVTFEQMAGQMARDAGLTLFYQGEAIEVDRVDQHEETDLDLLKRLADDYGYILKVSDSKIVLYDQEILEAAATVAVVDVGKGKGDGLIKHWNVHERTHGTYRASRVMYRNPIHNLVEEALKDIPKKEPKEPVYVPLKPRAKHRRLTNEQRKARDKLRQEKHDAAFQKKTDDYLNSLIRQARDEERRASGDVEVDDVEFFYSPAGAPLMGPVLEIERRVKDEAEARRIAKRKLRTENKKAIELALDLAGDVVMRASQNIELVRAGDFSGKYHIDQASHRVSGRSGYVTSVTAHRVLTYR